LRPSLSLPSSNDAREKGKTWSRSPYLFEIVLDGTQFCALIFAEMEIVMWELGAVLMLNSDPAQPQVNSS